MNLLDRSDFRKKVINAVKEELEEMAAIVGEEKAIQKLLNSYRRNELDKKAANSDGGYTIAVEFLKALRNEK